MDATPQVGVVRYQGPVPFRSILATLLTEHEPVVRGAIFCDDEGERVDSFAGDGCHDDELLLLGASMATVAPMIPRGACLRTVLSDAVVWLATVDCGCFLVVLCAPVRDGTLRVGLPRAVAALAAHM